MNYHKAREQSISVILADQPIPPDGPLNIEVNISATVNISAEEARRKVNNFAHRDLSYLMRAEFPSLVAAGRVYWRVPIVLTLPSYGAIGTVGTIDVDVESGELNTNREHIMEIQRCAKELASRTVPKATAGG